MKFVALVSGGKDSIYSIMESIKNGHELVACAHLCPSPMKQQPNKGEKEAMKDEEEKEDEEEESYMYQTAASECVPTLVKECLGVPLVMIDIAGKSRDTSLVYDHHNHQDSNVKGTCENDEVEDLYLLLQYVLKLYPDIKAVSSGAILSTYQRTRIESVCDRLNLTPLSYLWRIAPQRELLERMLGDGIDAVLVKVASPPGLIPHKHLNKSLSTLLYGGILDRLRDLYDVHTCGEGGEYETLVLNCPMFRRRLVLEQTSIIEDHQSCDGVGILTIQHSYSVPKENADNSSDDNQWAAGGIYDQRILRTQDAREYRVPRDTFISDRESPAQKPSNSNSNIPSPQSQPLTNCNIRTNVKVLPGGLAHISGMISKTMPSLSNIINTHDTMGPNKGHDEEALLALLEAKSIFKDLGQILSNFQWVPMHDNDSHSNYHPNDSTKSHYPYASPQDVIFVHLYLSNMSHFALINSIYSAFFGTVLPPSRSCVAVGREMLPCNRRVMLDCMIQRGSGSYMRIKGRETEESEMQSSTHTLTSTIQSCSIRNGNDQEQEQMGRRIETAFVKQAIANPHNELRSTLHVQSISHWAPVCVGPYSQANSIRSGMLMLAGQIGLEPSSMTLKKGTNDDDEKFVPWKIQLKQAWKNAASILDALDGEIQHTLSGVVYISSNLFLSCGSSSHLQLFTEVDNLCRNSIKNNCGIEAGKINDYRDKRVGEEAYGGYQDEETWREMTSSGAETKEPIDDSVSKDSTKFIPLLIVAIPQMPVGAITEVELLCATAKAASSVGLSTSSYNSPFDSSKTIHTFDTTKNHINWDVGFDGPRLPSFKFNDKYSLNKKIEMPHENDNASTSSIKINSYVRSAGNRCLAICTTTASFPEEIELESAHPKLEILEHIFKMMMVSAMPCLSDSADLSSAHILHVRLYYCATGGNKVWINTHEIFGQILESIFNDDKKYSNSVPAYTVVPVQNMHLQHSTIKTANTKFAIQIIAADPIHMETELWIHHR